MIEDELPKKMCLNCISEMNQAFTFKQKCERSEKTLRSILEHTESMKENVKNQHSIESLSKLPEAHLGEVPNLEIYQCIKCSEVFKMKSDIEHHSCDIQQQIEIITAEYIDSIQSDDQTETLLSNNESNETKKIVEDFIAENTLKYNCTYCKATFSSRRSLKLHANSRKCMEKSYECDICRKVFIKKRYLIRHLQRVHQMPSELRSNEGTDEAKMLIKRKYKCDLCPKGECSELNLLSLLK